MHPTVLALNVAQSIIGSLVKEHKRMDANVMIHHSSGDETNCDAN